MFYNEELGITYRDLVEDTHEIPFEHYQTLYGHFAGDLVFIENKKKKGKKYIIEDRWGGIPEIEALSNICEIPIVIYSPQKFDDKKNKIVTGRIQRRKAEKGYDFMLDILQRRKYLENKQPLLLMWKENKTRSSLYVFISVSN